MISNNKIINKEKLYNLLQQKPPNIIELNDILNKALKINGLDIFDVAKLLLVNSPKQITMIQDAAKIVKEKIYGKRLVLFAPLYLSNYCDNNCLYCGFRKDNKDILRKKLNSKEIKDEVESLLKTGHKRLLILTGESLKSDIDYIIKSIRLIYKIKVNNNSIRRINVEIAPLTINDFKRLKKEKIGTYICFQETYDDEKYKIYHPTGKKSDYYYRLYVMDRAIKSGIDDVGIGVLFGLNDYRFEVLALLEHSNYLERKYGCGPHTISIPRIEPAIGAPLSKKVPYPVSDIDFKKIVAILRLAVPYTGIILSTREKASLRNELFQYGVSQISAGSKTNPGAYSKKCNTGSQFSLGDHRDLDAVIADILDMGYIPSFCTSCYRMGRTGKDFMDLAKPGLIQKFCEPNAIITFYEYLIDYGKKTTKEKSFKLINNILKKLPLNLSKKINTIFKEIKNGKRDIYL
ncbi:MAG: [FeFe] hydrogenase H-cluster radical SAM maturase HydG [Candidatus Goldbacteria bacterium]|nr:[FeFe] hydrogenase H-cluster radical SAM maturase HydG [Candidatus Goldiibacteriota bacterium]